MQKYFLKQSNTWLKKMCTFISSPDPKGLRQDFVCPHVKCNYIKHIVFRPSWDIIW